MLVAFPLGLLALVPVWDVLAWSKAVPEAATVAYWSQLAGLVAGLLAAMIGVVDLVHLSSQPKVLQSGLRHVSFAVFGICILGVAFAMRTRVGVPSVAVMALDFVGAASLLAAGWFGGHLVFHHRVGVAPEEPLIKR